MTAIYAFARDRIAFVGGDTLRYALGGVIQTVCKLHHWSGPLREKSRTLPF